MDETIAVHPGPTYMSAEFGQLAAALSKAQRAMENPAKTNAVNTGRYSYSYANFAQIRDAVRGPLADNEIGYVFVPTVEGGKVHVITRLLHSSNQWIECHLAVGPIDTSNAQAIGSAVSYLKRYGLSALTGLATDDDDDGQAAVAGSGQRQARRGQQQPAQEPAPSDNPPPAANGQRPATHAQLGMIRTTATRIGMDGDALLALVREVTGNQELAALIRQETVNGRPGQVPTITNPQASAVIDKLKAMEEQQR